MSANEINQKIFQHMTPLYREDVYRALTLAEVKHSKTSAFCPYLLVKNASCEEARR